ncbi:MAG: hypothetical protein WCA13_01930 [Terriglobales bacterium]
MKTAFALLLLAPLSLAQNSTTASASAPGCGPADVHFDVKTDKHQHSVIQPESGKSLVYFLQDDSEFLSHPRPTARWGIDGDWVGATSSNSFFYVSITPGEHHLCASWQSFVGFGVSENTAAAHFTADPGGVYFYRARDFWTKDRGPAHIELRPLDSDEGQLLAGKFSFSTSQAKK